VVPLILIGLLYLTLQVFLFQASRASPKHVSVYYGRLAGLSLTHRWARRDFLRGVCLTPRSKV